jgi:hypothetical protein
MNLFLMVMANLSIYRRQRKDSGKAINRIFVLLHITAENQGCFDTVGRRLLNGITSSMRTKPAYSKQVYQRYVAPSIGSASEETASDSSFSGDLTEACLSDQHQELYSSDIEDSDREVYSTCRSARSDQSSTSHYASSSVYQRSIHTKGNTSDLRPKKSLMSLFQPSNASRRGSATSEGDSTTVGRVVVTTHNSCFCNAPN